MKLGMTGSRKGISDSALKTLQEFLDTNKIEEGHHGDCRGADTTFHKEITKNKIKSIIHPPSNPTMRSFCKGDESRKPLPYLDRNHEIVDESDELIAFPATKQEVIRSGS
jgi:hypothetical protein